GNLDGGWVEDGLNYIMQHRLESDANENYPNYSGVKWGIANYSTNNLGTAGILTALDAGPVAVTFIVYTDFASFFENVGNASKVYRPASNATPSEDLNGNIIGHAVVIVGTGSDASGQYWMCKNSWGPYWADGGYFKIGFGQCGIDDYGMSVTISNPSSYAKIIPDLINSLNVATSCGFANGESAIVKSTTSLSGNAEVPSNATIRLKANVNLNGYSLVSTGGTIVVDYGVTVTGVRAYMKNNSIIKGYCSTINSACNYASSNDLVDIQSGTFTENISYTGKNYLNITGKGIGQTTINGTISVYSSIGNNITDLSCKSVIANGSNVNVWGNVTKGDMSTGSMAYAAWNSSGNWGGTAASAYYGCYASGSNINFYLRSPNENISITSNIYGVSAESNSNVVLYQNYQSSFIKLCGNYGYEYSASSGAGITASRCSYPSGAQYPRIQLSGGTVTINGKYDCSGLGKIAGNGNATVEGIAVNANPGSDPDQEEFEKANRRYTELTNSVYADISSSKKFDKEKYRNDFITTIDGFKVYLDKYPNSSHAKRALTTATHCFKQLEDFESMKLFLQGIGEDKKITSITPLAKRLMIDYYINQKAFDKAILTADEILNDQKTDTTLICDILYAKGLVYAHDLDKSDDAVLSFSSIVNNYPENSLGYLAVNELKLLGFDVKKENKEAVSIETSTSDISNYPNPFNPSTTIAYAIPQSGMVSLKVYDIMGRELATLVNEYKTKGRYTVTFNASHLSSGTYLYRIQSETFTAIKKMQILK
ncbi:MAG TPA: C1 family peptidase, partial [Nitrosomonas sp.]|nr:C1 family peptidase [Nitrosomonas sp.]